MKKIRTIVLAAFAALSMSASAQEPFATFYLQYNPTQFHHKEIYGADTKDYFNQVAIGYNYATPLFGIPLYLEFGGAFQYSFKSGDGYKVNMLAGKIPVNLLYSFDVSESVRIQPYAGTYGRFNFLAKTKPDEEEAINWFDSPQDGKRFQMGLQGGIKFVFSDVVIGGGYYYDLMNIMSDSHFEGFEITIGMQL